MHIFTMLIPSRRPNPSHVITPTGAMCALFLPPSMLLDVITINHDFILFYLLIFVSDKSREGGWFELKGVMLLWRGHYNIIGVLIIQIGCLI